jgi:hypothetical protein
MASRLTRKATWKENAVDKMAQHHILLPQRSRPGRYRLEHTGRRAGPLVEHGRRGRQWNDNQARLQPATGQLPLVGLEGVPNTSSIDCRLGQADKVFAERQLDLQLAHQ